MAQNNTYRMLYSFLLLLLIIDATLCLENYDIASDNSGVWVIEPMGNLLHCFTFGCVKVAYLPAIIRNTTCNSLRCTGF